MQAKLDQLTQAQQSLENKQKEKTETSEDIATSRGERGRCTGRATLLAKKRASGSMQRPAELVPIRYGSLWFVKAPVKVTAFWQNPQNLVIF